MVNKTLAIITTIEHLFLKRDIFFIYYFFFNEIFVNDCMNYNNYIVIIQQLKY